MPQTINATFGVLESRIIHLTTDEEIQMMKSLIQDIISLKTESQDSSQRGWATFFLAAAFSSFLTILALSGSSPFYNLVWVLIFVTGCLGVYFFWNWRVNKKKEASALQVKQQQLKKLFAKIESRVPKEAKPANEYTPIIMEDQLDLKQL